MPFLSARLTFEFSHLSRESFKIPTMSYFCSSIFLLLIHSNETPFLLLFSGCVSNIPSIPIYNWVCKIHLKGTMFSIFLWFLSLPPINMTFPATPKTNLCSLLFLPSHSHDFCPLIDPAFQKTSNFLLPWQWGGFQCYHIFLLLTKSLSTQWL